MKKKSEKKDAKLKDLNRQSSTLIIVVASIVVLLLLAYFGMTLSTKGTFSVGENCEGIIVDAEKVCEDNLNSWVPVDSSHCCPTSQYHLENGLCVYDDYTHYEVDAVGFHYACSDGYSLYGDRCLKDGWEVDDNYNCVNPVNITAAFNKYPGAPQVAVKTATCSYNFATETFCSIPTSQFPDSSLIECGSGKSLIGWSLTPDVDYTNMPLTEALRLTQAGRNIIYPVCKNNTVTITFKSVDEETTIATKSCEIGSSGSCLSDITAPTAPDITGYTFRGWSETSNNYNCNPTYAGNATFRPNTNETYYACYTPVASSSSNPTFDSSKCSYSNLFTVTRTEAYLGCRYVNIEYNNSSSEFTESNISACCTNRGYTFVPSNFTSSGAANEYCVTCSGSDTCSALNDVDKRRCNLTTGNIIEISCCYGDLTDGYCRDTNGNNISKSNIGKSANSTCAADLNACHTSYNGNDYTGLRCNMDTNSIVDIKCCYEGNDDYCITTDNEYVIRGHLGTTNNSHCVGTSSSSSSSSQPASSSSSSASSSASNSSSSSKSSSSSSSSKSSSSSSSKSSSSSSSKSSSSVASSSKSNSVVASSSTTVVPSNSSNIDKGPQTGSAAIIVAWIVGLIAMGYSFWYFRQSRIINNK